MLRKTRESMTNSTVLQMREIIGLPHVKNVKHKPQQHRFEYDNGSVLAYGGMKDDKQKEAIRSIGKDGSVDFVWMEEATAFDESDFSEVTARMRGKAAPFRCIMLTTNPDAPSHWINKRLILGEEASCYFSSARDNPANPPEYLQALNSLTGLEAKRLRDGLWCQAEGVIYDMFEMDLVVDTDFELPYPSQYKEVFAGADSNFPLPRAAVLIVKKGDVYLVLDEFYMRGAHVEQLGKWLEEKARIHEQNITVYHDPSDPAAIDHLSTYQGISSEKADNKVLPGISEVARLFNEKRLFIHKRCTNLINEIQSYRWKNDGKDQPLKEQDHLCFTANTKIITINGEKNIKDITCKDYVLTRKGWKKVLVSTKTSNSASVIELTLNNNKKINCTPNHPFITTFGKVRADTLSNIYKLIRSDTYLCKTKNLMEKVITNVQMDIGEEPEDITTFIEMCGKSIKDTYRKVITYIILMVINLIISFQTSNVLHQNNITKNIRSKIKKNKRNIWKKSENSQKYGIEVKKGESGIQIIGKIHLVRHLRKEYIFVKNVVKNLYQERHKAQSIVTKTAKQELYVKDVKWKKKKVAVYNIHVEGCHEYFANGVLVSNCDALRYAIMSHKPQENIGEFDYAFI